MTPALAVLLKAPRLGTVKTRLAAEIGARQALRLYRVLAQRTLAEVRVAGLEATVWFTPVDAATEMRHWLGEGWDLRPQASGDLGTRLAAAAQAVPPGRGWLAIGADCPRLDAALLREAAAVVARDEIVLGPSLDGGYYLVGGPMPLPDLFSAMPWSTSRVLGETRARLLQAKAPGHELVTLRDVDTAEDARAEGLLT
jgi:rSAM/selenodomain-associated transferase 1